MNSGMHDCLHGRLTDRERQQRRANYKSEQDGIKRKNEWVSNNPDASFLSFFCMILMLQAPAALQLSGQEVLEEEWKQREVTVLSAPWDGRISWEEEREDTWLTVTAPSSIC